MNISDKDYQEILLQLEKDSICNNYKIPLHKDRLDRMKSLRYLVYEFWSYKQSVLFFVGIFGFIKGREIYSNFI